MSYPCLCLGEGWLAVLGPFLMDKSSSVDCELSGETNGQKAGRHSLSLKLEIQ